MKDFLDECKNTFFMESDIASSIEIQEMTESILFPKVDLTYYAHYNIPNYQSITEIPKENIDYLNSGLITSNMSYMFNYCKKLQSIPKLNINTSKCTSTLQMFGYCSSLSLVDLSWLDTTNVNTMRWMFDGCESLTTLNISNFNTINVTHIGGMFRNCHSLASLDLSKFDTSNVTYMGELFSNCKLLTILDLSNWNTSNVNNMYSMFYGCNSLASLDLSSFDTSNVEYMHYAFNNCNSLTTIKGTIDMNFCTLYDNMFYGCSNLSGVKIKNPPQDYYDKKSRFESDIGLTSDQYEIVS